MSEQWPGDINQRRPGRAAFRCDDRSGPARRRASVRPAVFKVFVALELSDLLARLPFSLAVEETF